MDLFYRSTRSKDEKVTASQAILQGLAQDGGLFVPESIPRLDKSLEELSRMNYQETAYEVMKLFLTDFTKEELQDCINKAYDSKFDTEVIAPLVEADGAYYPEEGFSCALSGARYFPSAHYHQLCRSRCSHPGDSEGLQSP